MGTSKYLERQAQYQILVDYKKSTSIDDTVMKKGLGSWGTWPFIRVDVVGYNDLH